MTVEQETASTGESWSQKLSRDYGRARTYAVLYCFAVPTFAYVAYFVESEELVASFDDLTIIGISTIALSLLVVRWRKASLIRLAKLNDVLFVLGLWIAVFSVFALEVEAGFSDDLVDEAPKLVLSILLVANRLV